MNPSADAFLGPNGNSRGLPLPMAIPSPPAPPLSPAAEPPLPGWSVRYGSSADSPDSPPAASGGWQRPADWLPMPSLSPEEQKVIALVAVFPADNEVCIAAAGSFLIDWGDGHSQQVLSPSQATERFHASFWTDQALSRYSLNIAATDPAWTQRDPASQRIRWSGLDPLPPDRVLTVVEDGQVVLLFEPALSIQGGWWLEIHWLYLDAVLSPTLVRHTYRHDNPALAGSDCRRGYRQALLCLTPLPGEQLTALSLQNKVWEQRTFSAWLDVASAAPSLQSLIIGER
ncbi:MAG: hypothetical protein ACK55R_10315 [Cyanobacteriota bacterium]